MRFTKLVLTAALAFGGAQTASAAIVTFEELAPNTSYNSPLTSGGLTFRNSGDPAGPVGTDGFYAVAPGANGTITLAPNFFGSTTTVNAASPFTLTSFDFSDAFDLADDPVRVLFTFNLFGGGTTTRTYIADLVEGMQTQLVGISNITSFSFVTSGSQFGENTIQTDNWNYTLSAAGAVPEPATWAMMILGFGLIGGAMRRRETARIRFV